jgi:hypothetical protein
MCRNNVDLKNYEKNALKKNQWSLLEIDNEEYIEECNELFLNSFNELIGSNSKK